MGSACSGPRSSAAAARYESSGVVGGSARTEERPSAETLSQAARSRIRPEAAEASRQTTLGRYEAAAKNAGRSLAPGYREMSETQLRVELERVSKARAL